MLGLLTFLDLFLAGVLPFTAMSDELTAAQVAERLDVGRSTVNLWCRQGKFPGARVEESPVGDYWLIPARDLKDFQPPKRGRIPRKAASTEKPASEAVIAGNGRSGRKKGGKK